MSRTKAEVRAFLDSQVGKIVPHPGYPSLNGQCVTLTKALMEFLGVPNPYTARGDAINAGDTYIRQGLGSEGRGWLTIVVNRDMGYINGVHYGHIWIDLLEEANYESNGARALYTTKNTRPLSQGQQFVNFDKWITDGGTSMDTNLDQARAMAFAFEGRDGFYGPNALTGACDADLNKYVVGKKKLDVALGDFYTSPTANDFRGRYMPALVAQANNATLYQNQATALQKQNEELQKKLSAYENGDTIVITRKGWNGLFDVLQQWFSKKNV